MENRYLVDFGLEGNFVCGEFQGEFAGRVGGKKAERAAVVDNPVGAGGEEGGVVHGGTNGDDAAASRFAGLNAERRVFDDHAVLRVEMERSGAFEIRLGMGLTFAYVAGGDEMDDVWP